MSGPGDNIGGFVLREKIRERDWCDIWLADAPVGSEDAGGLSVVELLVARPDAAPARVAHGMLVLGRVSKAGAPGMQRVLAVYPSGGHPFAVLQPRRGEGLDSIVARRGPLGSADVARLAAQIGRAMAALNAHGEIAMRSIKPSNVMLDADGTLTLCDYSLAILPTVPGHDASIDGGEIVGTPQYLSPEQAAGADDIRFSADLYSLGATLYFAATGSVPFGDRDPYEVLDLQQSGALPNPMALNGAIEPGVAELIRLLMMKEPAHRHRGWSRFVADAEAVENGGMPKWRPPEFAVSTVESGQPEPKLRGFNDLAADDSDARPPLSRVAFHAVLWLVLLAWLVLLGNVRVGNPMGLPLPKLPAWLSPATEEAN